MLDWRLRGFLSRFVRGGKISGKRDEFVYVPILHQGTIRHLLLVGLGSSSNKRPLEDSELKILDPLSDAISGLKFERVAISRSSFPFLDEKALRTSLKNVQLEFTQ